jgi:hypothetical protein
MRTPGILSLLIVATIGCNTTERIVRLDADEAAPLPTYDANQLRARYGSVPGVYLTYDRTLEHNVSIAFTSTIPHWRFFEVMQRSMVVLDPKSEQVNAFRLAVGPDDRLEQISITVQAPGSGGQVFERDDLIEQRAPDGGSIFTLSYGNMTPGTIVSEAYEVSFGDLERDPPVFHDLPLQFAFPAEQLHVQYIYPMWWQVQVKQLGAGQYLPYQRIEDAGKRKIRLQYQSQNVPALPANVVFARDVAPYFQIQVSNMSMGSAVRYRAPESWEELGSTYAGFAGKVSSRDEREVRDVSRQITGTLTTERDKVSAVLRYVVDNITIDPTARDRGMETMLAKRTGNPFMVTELAMTMLEEAGIGAEYLVLHSARDGFFDPTFFSDRQFQVPALNVFADGAEHLVIPGTMKSIADPLPDEFAGQTAIVITRDGFGGFSELGGQRLASAGPMPAGTSSPPQTIVIPDPNALPIDDEQLSTDKPVADAANRPAPVVDHPGPRNTPVIDSPTVQPVPRPTAGDAGGIVGQPIGSRPSPSVDVNPPPVQVVPPPAAAAMPAWMGSIDRMAGGWTWIIGSKTTVEEAEVVGNEYLDLYQQGLKVDILSGRSNGAVRYRIALGQYTSRNLAQIDRERLGSLIPSDAWLLQIEPGM